MMTPVEEDLDLDDDGKVVSIQALICPAELREALREAHQEALIANPWLSGA